FPDPDCPMIATNSPFSMIVETPSSARTSTSPRLYTLLIVRASISAISEHPRTSWRLCHRLFQRLDDKLLTFFQLAGDNLGIGTVADAWRYGHAPGLTVVEQPDDRTFSLSPARGGRRDRAGGGTRRQA